MFTLEQSESAICMYIFPLFWTSLPLSSLQSIEKSACAVICLVHGISSIWASLVAQTVKNLPTTWEAWAPSLGWEDPLEEGMATRSCLLAWGSHGQRSLVSYKPWGCTDLGTTEWLTHKHTSIVYICQFQSPSSSHPFFPPWCPQVCPLSVSLFLLCKYDHLYHFSRVHIYALICDIYFWLASLWMALSRSIHVSGSGILTPPLKDWGYLDFKTFGILVF